MSDQDRILKTLEETHKKRDSGLPFYLVQRTYEAQRNFLFEKDRSKPMEMLKQIVDEFAENNGKKE